MAMPKPLRPMREMQQMQALRAWQKAHAPLLSEAGLMAIWREIIGMALSQQGGISIYASQAAMATARAHFGASLTYETCAGDLSALADESRAIAVLTLAEACAPADGMAVFARLPLAAPQPVYAMAHKLIRPDCGGRGVFGAPRGPRR